MIDNPTNSLNAIAKANGYQNYNALADALGFERMATDFGIGKEAARKEKETAKRLLSALHESGYTEPNEETESNKPQQPNCERTRCYTPHAGEQHKRYNPAGKLGYGEDEDDEVFCGVHR
jgi:hypothetical protein